MAPVTTNARQYVVKTGLPGRFVTPVARVWTGVEQPAVGDAPTLYTRKPRGRGLGTSLRPGRGTGIRGNPCGEARDGKRTQAVYGMGGGHLLARMGPVTVQGHTCVTIRT
jgi:hypothetical protein